VGCADRVRPPLLLLREGEEEEAGYEGQPTDEEYQAGGVPPAAGRGQPCPVRVARVVEDRDGPVGSRGRVTESGLGLGLDLATVMGLETKPWIEDTPCLAPGEKRSSRRPMIVPSVRTESSRNRRVSSKMRTPLTVKTRPKTMEAIRKSMPFISHRLVCMVAWCSHISATRTPSPNGSLMGRCGG